MFGNDKNNGNESSSSSTTNSIPPSAEPSGVSTPLSTSAPASSTPSSPSVAPSKQSSSNNGPPPATSTKERLSRRISSNSVTAFMASAKNSLTHSSSSDDHTLKKVMSTPTQSSASKSAEHDPHNNSAGRSQPTSCSTFRVGVSEDKNKRCRRTMEDTHAFLYNFLPPNIPARAIQYNLNSCDQDNKVMAYSTLEENTNGVSDNGYFAIFDGHAGTFAADWCGKKLHHLLEDNIRQNPKRSIPEILDLTFTNVDKELKDLPVKNSGCTAVCAVLRWEQRTPEGQLPALTQSVSASSVGDRRSFKEKLKRTTSSTSQSSSPPPPIDPNLVRSRVLYTANVGDARIVLCRGGKALRLSYDHKGSDENEGKRVSNAGGLILNNRVNGVLAVTRALGDSYIKDLVTGHPYTTETIIDAEVDEFLILACDGLWDVCSDQEAVDHIRTVQDPQDASQMLVEHALARFSTDNLSCMVVRFDKPKKSHSATSPVSTSTTTAAGVGLGLKEDAHIPPTIREKPEDIAENENENEAEGESAVVDEDVVMSDDVATEALRKSTTEPMK